MKIKTIAFILLTSTALAGCSTAEYKYEYDSCKLESYSKFPVNYKMVESICYKDVEIKTGELECATKKHKSTADIDKERNNRPIYYIDHSLHSYRRNSPSTLVCKEIIEVKKQAYNCQIEIDTNSQPRDLDASNCAANRCMSKFGNKACKN